jgi:hypothetical protein
MHPHGFARGGWQGMTRAQRPKRAQALTATDGAERSPTGRSSRSKPATDRSCIRSPTSPPLRTPTERSASRERGRLGVRRKRGGRDAMRTRAQPRWVDPAPDRSGGTRRAMACVALDENRQHVVIVSAEPRSSIAVRRSDAASPVPRRPNAVRVASGQEHAPGQRVRSSRCGRLPPAGRFEHGVATLGHASKAARRGRAATRLR